jgi:ribulose-5-phosphate 4-epimerase/fuculose-1-phosphate aldolase
VYTDCRHRQRVLIGFNIHSRTKELMASIAALTNRMDLAEDLALALRAAAYHGFSEGICNHFSLALPDEQDRFLINPRGVHWARIGAEDLVLVDGEGRKLAGRHEVEPTAMFIHAAVHRLSGRACVLHTHMPFATALCLTQPGMLDTRLSQNAMRFHGRVAVDSDYGGLALDVSEGERIAAALGKSDAIFLANHGVIVCGDRMDHSYDDLYYLEAACRAECQARATGMPLTRVDERICEATVAQFNAERDQSTLFFEELRRIVPAP